MVVLYSQAPESELWIPPCGCICMLSGASLTRGSVLGVRVRLLLDFYSRSVDSSVLFSRCVCLVTWQETSSPGLGSSINLILLYSTFFLSQSALQAQQPMMANGNHSYVLKGVTDNSRFKVALVRTERRANTKVGVGTWGALNFAPLFSFVSLHRAVLSQLSSLPVLSPAPWSCDEAG